MPGHIWLDGLHSTAPAAVAVGANAILVSLDQHLVGAGTVHTINKGASNLAAVPGDEITLRPDGAVTVLLQGAGGNIRTVLTAEIALVAITDFVTFRWNGTNWIMVEWSLQAVTPKAVTIDAGGVGAAGQLREALTLDTQAAAAVDDLDTITGGALGAVVTLGITDNARVIVLTQAGNIRLSGARTRVLASTLDRCMLRFNGTNWVEVQVTTQSDGYVRRKAALGPSAGVVNIGTFNLSHAVDAGTLRVGDTYRVRALFRASVQAGISNTTYTLSFAGVVIATTTATDLDVNGYAIVEADVRINTVGSPGTFTSFGEAYQRVALPGAPTVTVQDNINSNVDTAVAQSFTADVTQNGADTSILEIFEVEVL